MMQDLGSLRRVLGQIGLALHSVLVLIHTLVALLEACQQTKVGPNFIGLQLAEFFKSVPYFIQV